jgi:hypothetical protein
LRIGRGACRLKCAIGSGEGFSVFPVDDFADRVFGRNGLFQLVHLAKGFERGLHEVSEGAGLAVVDGVAGECVGNGIEIVEYGSVVFHVDEGHQGSGAAAHGWKLRRAAGLAAALVVHVAKIVVFERGHGAACTGEAEMAAARVVGSFADAGFVRVHFHSF